MRHSFSCLAFLLTLLAASAAGAQMLELKRESDQPFYRYSATVPDPQRAEGSDSTITVEMLLSERGDIADIAFLTPEGRCRPVCRVVGGKLRCLGCDDGLNPTLRIIEIAVASPGADAAAGMPTVEMTYRSLDTEKLPVDEVFSLKPDQ